MPSVDGWLRQRPLVTLSLVLMSVLQPSGFAGAMQQEVAELDKGDSPAVAAVSGKVVMANSGEPVAGAEVRLSIRVGNRIQAATTLSDETGRFRFDTLAEGQATIAAFYQNLASRSQMYRGQETKAGDDSLVLELRPAPAMQVRVAARADNRPLANATVRLTWSDIQRDHRTDDNGEVTIRGLTPEVWTIEVQAKGHAEQVHAVNLSSSEVARVDAQLDPGAELFGVVRDQAGQPLADVGISVFPHDFSGEQIEYMKTDAQGRYRFAYLPIAGLRLSISKEGYQDQRPEITITAPPGGEQQLNITLAQREDGGSVRGVVMDTRGNPIAGATLANHGRSSRDVRKTTTDQQGRYRLDDVFPSGGASHEVFVKAAGFAPQRLMFKPGSRDEPAELDITLEPGRRLRGAVVDENGEPIAGVAVYSHGNSFPGVYLGSQVNTDSAGRFELDSLPANPSLLFVKQGYSDLRDVTLPLDDQQEVVITLQPQGILRGRVIDARSGEPVKPFVVQVTFSPDGLPTDPRGNLSGARAFQGERFDTPDGNFELGEFLLGLPLQVTIEAEGYQRHVARRVVTERAAAAERLTFALERIDESSLIQFAGRLVDDQDRPLAGAEVRLIVASQPRADRDRFPFGWMMIRSGQIKSQPNVLQFLSSTTDNQGQFAFERVIIGEAIEIVYWGDGVSQGHRTGLEKLSEDARGAIMLRSPRPVTIRGTFDRAELEEIGDIVASTAGDTHRAVISLETNSYEIRNVPPGRFELQIYGPMRPIEQDKPYFTREVIGRFTLDGAAGETVTLDFAEQSSGLAPRAD